MNNLHPAEPQQHLRTVLGHRQTNRLSIIEILRYAVLSMKIILFR